MSSDRPQQTSVNRAPHEEPAGAKTITDSQTQESALVQLFQELTGENESQARSAFMYAVGDKQEVSTTPKD